jgi:probable HAF family extracellular repeat protein
VGYYLDARAVFHGFLLSGGQYTTLDDPHAGTGAGTLQGTIPTGINASGVITGYYIGPNNDFHGFLLSQGQYTTIDEPNAAPGPFLGTETLDINAFGQIVGNYETANLVLHGFLLANGQYTTLDDPNAGTGALQGTFPSGINASSKIVGQYTDANGLYHGFLATPAQRAAATLILFPPTAPASAATSAGIEHPFAVAANTVNPASANAALDGTLSHANPLASVLPSAVAHLRAATLAQQISDSLFEGVAGDKLWAWNS